MRRSAIGWTLGVLGLALAGPLGAESPLVRAFVRPDGAVREAEPFELVLQIDGAATPQVTLPAFRGTPELRLVGGPNTSSRMSFVNGRSTASYQVVYVLVATRVGRFEIPELALEIDGKPHRTAAVALRVDPGVAARPGPSGSPTRAADPVFLEARLGAEEAFVGEPVSLTVTLYASRSVSDPSWIARPSFDRFWAETIDLQADAEAAGRRRIGDQVYAVYPVERRVLVAPSPGEFEIEPYVLQLRAPVRSGDVFDLFSLGRSETLVRKSEPLLLKVRQLPPGEPAGFGGAVGRYTLLVALDRAEAAVDDAVALRVTVEGSGVLHSVSPPALEPSADVKLFEPRVAAATSQAGDTLRSRKTWEWILVPLRPGELRLPEVRFPYFDPDGERYEVARATPAVLLVRRDADGQAPRSARGSFQVEGRDLAYIKGLDGRLALARRGVHERASYRVLLALPVLLAPAFVVLGRRHARRRQDLGQTRARRALGRARARLRGVRRRLDEREATAFHEELGRALVEYVADRFDRSAAGMTYDEADNLLAARGVADPLRRGYRGCLEACDFARFVPAAARAERRTELLDEAARIVEALERAW